MYALPRAAVTAILSVLYLGWRIKKAIKISLILEQNMEANSVLKCQVPTFLDSRLTDGAEVAIRTH
jgi:hypothetical protein